jgi:hypothetical protein
MCDYRNGKPFYIELERLMLPNPDESGCPWCQELRLLESTEANTPIESRLKLLQRSRAGGLTEPFFSSATMPPVGPGSILLPSDTEADLMIAAASAVQHLRSRGELNASADLPTGRALDPAFFLEGRFSAQAITAALLRAARSYETRGAQVDVLAAQYVAHRLTDNIDRCLHIEFAIAAALGKLPLLDPARISDESDRDVAQRLLASVTEAPLSG